VTNASRPHNTASGTPTIPRKAASITATIRPKIVETTRYVRVPWAKPRSALTIAFRSPPVWASLREK
jgi:hypothetical protein